MSFTEHFFLLLNHRTFFNDWKSVFPPHTTVGLTSNQSPDQQVYWKWKHLQTSIHTNSADAGVKPSPAATVAGCLLEYKIYWLDEFSRANSGNVSTIKACVCRLLN